MTYIIATRTIVANTDTFVTINITGTTDSTDSMNTMITMNNMDITVTMASTPAIPDTITPGLLCMPALYLSLCVAWGLMSMITHYSHH